MLIPRLSFGKLVHISSSLMTLLLAMNMHTLAEYLRDDGTETTGQTLVGQAKAAEGTYAEAIVGDAAQPTPAQAAPGGLAAAKNAAQGWVSLLHSDSDDGADPAPAPASQPAVSEGDCPKGITCVGMGPTTGTQGGDADPEVNQAEAGLVKDILARRLDYDSEQKNLDEQKHVINAAKAALDERMRELDTTMAALAEKQAAHQETMSAETDRLVKIYEEMPAKAAAAVFNIMDIHVLVSVANKMNPRKVSAIMGDMAPERVNLVSQYMAGVRSFHPPHTSTGGDGAAEQADAVGGAAWWSKSTPAQRPDSGPPPLKPS
jgi:flagellar motility protein MotE (MotC chaperone)